ncbi:MAG: right-handed parallel beta-helix repeat-containing protein [Lentisphaeria bacterium]|nr:right-handed parallel beta-helix repeat-containing protein [Lentisphaeria bacterium]
MKKIWGLALGLTLSLGLVSTIMAQTVKVSDFKPHKDDATAAMQSAIDSGAKTVIVDDPGFEYLVETINLRSNLELVFADKVVVRAKPGAFLGKGDFLFSIRNVKNLIMRGEGKAVLKMNKKDYQDESRYEHSEWRHAIALYGSDDIVIKNLSILSSGGDGVYLGSRGCKNVLLENLFIADHHRQGISVISAENLLIKNCTLTGTAGTPPQAGIDFEPNHSKDYLINCVVENCDIYENDANGILIGICALEKPISIVFRDCRVYNNSGALACSAAGNAEEKPLQGSISFEACSFSSPPGRRSLALYQQRVGGVRLSFRDCVVDNLNNKAAPIVLASSQMDDFDGVDFGNLLIKQALTQPVFEVMPMGMAGILPFAGSITLQDGSGQQRQVDFKPLYAQHRSNPEFRSFKSLPLKTRGLLPISNEAEFGNTVQTRGGVELIQYAKAGETVNINFKVAWKSRGSINMPVIIRDSNGTEHSHFTITEPDYTYTFKPKGSGVYTFSYKTGGHAVVVNSSAAGWGFSASTGLPLFRSASELYFLVPAELREVAIRVGASMGEPVAVQLIDEKGKVVDNKPQFTGVQFLKASREASAKDEIWQIRLHQVVEDHNVRLGAPLKPIVYTSPKHVLREDK